MSEHPPLPVPPSAGDLRLADILRALADESRVGVVQQLADGQWHGWAEVAENCDVQKPTVSHHLRILREAGLIEYRPQGRTKDIRLRIAVIDSRFPGLLAGVTSPEAAADLAREG